MDNVPFIVAILIGLMFIIKEVAEVFSSTGKKE